MDKFTLIVVVLVVLIIIVAVACFLLQRYNTYANQNNILYPFYAAIQPGQGTAYLTNAAGTSQIDCSAVGGKINIVGAWSEVIDPYGSCSGNSTGILNLSCGLPTINIPCSSDNDCGIGMNCAGGVCKPSVCPSNQGDKWNFSSSNCSCRGNYCPVVPGKPCSGDSDCTGTTDPSNSMMQCDKSVGMCAVNPGQTCMAPDPFKQEVCAVYPLCSNLDTTSSASKNNVLNGICAFNNSTSECRPRDASAYLAGLCDGKQTCAVLFDPENPLSGFGPKPCRMREDQISLLPNIPGQGGNFGRGFYSHGLYTCVTS